MPRQQRCVAWTSIPHGSTSYLAGVFSITVSIHDLNFYTENTHLAISVSSCSHRMALTNPNWNGKNRNFAEMSSAVIHRRLPDARQPKPEFVATPFTKYLKTTVRTVRRGQKRGFRVHFLHTTRSTVCSKYNLMRAVVVNNSLIKAYSNFW